MDMIDRIIAREGGDKITEDPHDPGGLTKYGISQKAHPELDIRALTYDQAKDVYIHDYFVSTRIHMLPEMLQEAVMDFGVHSGPVTAIRYLQKIIGVPQDGVIGNQTLKAIAKNDLPSVFRALTRERVLFLSRQVVNKPVKLKYLVGWLNRVLSI